MADILNNWTYIVKMSPDEAMFSTNRVPVARILFPFLLGILTEEGTCFSIRPDYVCLATSICWGLHCIFFRHGTWEHPWNIVGVVILSSSVFMGTGYVLNSLSQPEVIDMQPGTEVILRGEVLQQAVPAGSGWVAAMSMEMLMHGDTCLAIPTQLQIYLRNPVGGVLPGPGEWWQLSGTLYPIRNRGNPGEIDYEAILSRKGFRYRVYVDGHSAGNRMLTGMSGSRISASGIRARLANRWEGQPEPQALLMAVCLGDRSGLTDEQKKHFQDAGGMHLLAVSGLHVGLIWWFLQRALGIVVRIFRREIFRVAPSVVLLWLYAFLTGFSSSVCRAVTMFTLFSVALYIDQRSRPLNTLALSAFLILVIDPDRIMDAGFQLSYAAVFGIVTLFPWLRKLPGKISNRIVRWTWEASAVSLAAQVSTLPLVVFYFRQFPVYGLLTNLMALPLLSLLMGLFILSLPLLILHLYPAVVSRLITFVADLLNRSAELVAGFPGAVIRDLHLDRINLVLLLVAILLGVLVIRERKHWPRYGVMLLIAAMNCWCAITDHMRKDSSLLLVTHFNRGSQILISQGKWMDCYRVSKDSLVIAGMDRYLSTSWSRMIVEVIEINPPESTAYRGTVSACHPVAEGGYLIGNERMKGWLVTRRAGDETLELIARNPGSFILLTGNATLSPEVIRRFATAGRVIADGSNSRGYVDQLRTGIPQLYVTAEHGAAVDRW